MHESFLVHRNLRYLKLAVGLSIIAIVLFAFTGPPTGHNGGTWLGYGLGGLGALLILWLMWFGIRKRHFGPGIWSLKGWLSAHVYLGLAVLIVGTLHTGFQFGLNIHTLAYVLMVIVILSGVWGAFAYVRYPRVMTENREGRTLEELLRAVAEADREARSAAMDLPDSYMHEVEASQATTRVGGSFWVLLTGRDPRCATARALARVRDMAKTAPAEDADEVGRLLVALAKKGELLARARRDVSYKALMDVWLFLHVPLSFGLLAALLIHIVSVFLYW